LNYALPEWFDPMPKPHTARPPQTIPLVLAGHQASNILPEGRSVSNGTGRQPFKSPFVRALVDKQLDVEVVMLEGTTVRTDRQYEEPGRKKFMVYNPVLLAAIRRGIGHATEVFDVIEALHDALPEKCQRWASIESQIDALISCGNQLDVGKALLNLAANEAEDRLIGRASRAGSQGRIDLGFYGPGGNFFGGATALGSVGF
jgi:hypothetical protein